MKRLMVVAGLILALLLGVATPGVAKTPIVVALSVGANEQSFAFRTYLKFIELAQQYSGQAFDFMLYPDMQLGDEQDSIRALQAGTTQIAAVATNTYATFAPSYGWMNMPYLFDSLDEFRSLVDSMWNQTNEWSVREAKCRTLMVIDVGYRQLTTNAKHPIRTLADARKAKIRVPQNAMTLAFFEALKLEPSVVSFAETLDALRQGEVDGQEGCFNNVVARKFYDSQKYATEINYAVHSGCFLVAETWFQSLPEKEREALVRAGKDAMTYERGQVSHMLQDDNRLMQFYGMELLGEVEDLPTWVQLGRDAWPRCIEILGGGDATRGKNIMDLVLAQKEALGKK